MLDGIVTDMLEAEAISFKRDLIDIYSASWGPADTGNTMEGPGPACKLALSEGVRKGRGGKGSIFVWATGNGGMVDDDCNCDGYVSSIESISIGSMSDRGLSTYFSEVCPSTMAVVPCGGDHALTDTRANEKPHIKVVGACAYLISGC
jgi:furin